MTRSKLMGLAALAVVLASTLLAPSNPAVAADLVAEKGVVLIRHVIRPPSSSERKLFEPLTTAAWPKWTSPDGVSTEHGKAAATRLGEYYRQRYSAVLGASGCDHAKDVFGWANSGSGRTIDSGDAFLKGVLPGCGVKVTHKNQKDVDPMFWSFGVGKTPLEPAATKAAILEAMGGSVESARQRYAADFEAANKVIPCCHVSLCEMTGLESQCSFSDLPWYLKEGGDPKFYQITGGAEMGQVISEQIRMAYTEGMPLEQVGWGKIANAQDVKKVLQLHRIRYKLFEETPYVAAKGGSQILKQILLSLTDGTKIEPSIDPAGKFPSAKLTVLAGHDTNIANLGALIGVTWQPEDYPENDTGPLGALVFDRLIDPSSKKQYIKLAYITPRMDALRKGLPFTDPANVEAIALPIPGCSDQVGAACELGEAVRLLEAKIDVKSTWNNDQ